MKRNFGYAIYYPGSASVTTGSVHWNEKPTYEEIAELVEPVVGGDFEHVTVLHNGQRGDMFVNETGAINGMKRNEAATAIYRNAYLNRHPEADPESLAAIFGPAIIFGERVWF